MKAAIVHITKSLLEQALGINFGEGIEISRASIDYNYFNSDTLVLILTGDGLSDVFTIAEGAKIKTANITIETRYGKTSITPAQEY